MKWITRERPKIDRVACPWLIARFVDADAEFLFAAPHDVPRLAHEYGATPFDIEGVELSHEGPLCSFDAILRKYGLTDPALLELAVIIRGADTAHLELAPQAAGLLAISLGLSRLFSDDYEQLRHGFVLYDALYAWSKYVRGETHTWHPQRVALRGVEALRSQANKRMDVASRPSGSLRTSAASRAAPVMRHTLGGRTRDSLDEDATDSLAETHDSRRPDVRSLQCHASRVGACHRHTPTIAPAIRQRATT